MGRVSCSGLELSRLKAVCCSCTCVYQTNVRLTSYKSTNDFDNFWRLLQKYLSVFQIFCVFNNCLLFYSISKIKKCNLLGLVCVWGYKLSLWLNCFLIRGKRKLVLQHFFFLRVKYDFMIIIMYFFLHDYQCIVFLSEQPATFPLPWFLLQSTILLEFLEWENNSFCIPI